MPEQPHRAEEMLQRHARERRAQARDVSLHPATRQLLQGEVKRQFGQQQRESTPHGIALWFTGWRTLGVSCALVALLGVAGWMAFRDSAPKPTNSELAKAEPQAESLAAKRAIKPEAEMLKEKVAASPAPLTVAPVAAPRPSAPGTQSSFAFKDATANTEVLRALTSPSAQPAAKELMLSGKLEFVAQRTDADEPIVSADKLMANTPLANGGLTANSVQLQTPAAAAQTLANNSAPVSRDTSPLQQQSGATEARQNQNVAANYAVQNNQSQRAAGFAGANTRASSESNANLNRGNSVTLANNNYYNQQTAAPQAPAAAQTSDTYQRQYSMSDTAARRFEPQRGQLTEGLAKAADATVLSRFSIEQIDSTVRVTDGDGSIYEGALVTEELDATKKQEAAKPAPTPLPDIRLGRESSLVRRTFRATGTNRTLNQLIVVDGKFSSSDTDGTSSLFVAPIQERKAIDRARALQEVPSGTTIPSTSPLGAAKASGGPNTNGVSSVEGTVRVGNSAGRSFRAVRVMP